ncbi:alcohol dehydrogenase catalytic domain-containing protein [Microbacterium profundi]|uniref:zinc-binding dehydrogenase n=1 Tax=Microbacterium profundi TaxID=450380 RepID=UPI001F3F7A30|nr:alcohol dehydrogenase catalytic domain-containing protein [Microbacterium profundi]MCE7482011.1 alcohol dehydrogenase catalytic domain-containing protein [Microbacterium profundi]
MRAALYIDAGSVIVDDVPDPVIQADTDAIVRVVRSCVCGSDLWSYRDTFKREPRSRYGHEFIGVVEQVGSAVQTAKVGDLVVAPFSYGCGTCWWCEQGLPTSCPNRGTWGIGTEDGGQGEALRTPYADANLVVAPGGLAAYDDAGLLDLLACTDVMATGLHGAVMAGVGEGSTAVVVGDGAVGLSAVLGATQILGAERVILLSRNPARQELGRRFGATDVVAERGEDAKRAVLELTDGHGAAHVIEAVGTAQSWQTALDAVSDGGMIGAVGVPHTAPTLDSKTLLVRNVGVRLGICPVRRYLDDLVGRVVAGTLKPGAVFDVTLPLEQTPEAYALMDRREAIKVALVP